MPLLLYNEHDMLSTNQYVKCFSVKLQGILMWHAWDRSDLPQAARHLVYGQAKLSYLNHVGGCRLCCQATSD